MMRAATSSPPFRLLRHFSLAGLLSILIVAVVIILFYRYMVIDAIHELGAELSTSTATSALRSINRDLERFIERQDDAPASRGPEKAAADTAARQAIDGLVNQSGIVRVEIYSRDGTVVYSTDHRQIGQVRVDNPGFVSAIQGQVANKLIYRDHLNPFDDEISDENLIQTFLPIVAQDSQRPIGVFEIYSDASHIVDRAAKSQLIVSPVVVGVLLLLYLYLLAIVRKASAMVEFQQRRIAERTQTLEVLTTKLLGAQEDERKRLANRLYEGIAQSLQAVKLAVEHQKPADDVDRSAPLVALIQETIDQAREFAVELRPSALDDFGLLEALNSFFNEFLLVRSNVVLERKFGISESDIPKPLKTIIFRIVQDTLKGLATETEADKIKVTLSRAANSLQLSITENAYSYRTAGNDASYDGEADATLLPMKERAILSGGEYEKVLNGDGSTSNVARWPV